MSYATKEWIDEIKDIVAKYPTAKFDSECDEILCDSEEIAVSMANEIEERMEELCVSCSVHTCYYNSEEDRISDPESYNVWAVYIM